MVNNKIVEMLEALDDLVVMTGSDQARHNPDQVYQAMLIAHNAIKSIKSNILLDTLGGK